MTGKDTSQHTLQHSCGGGEGRGGEEWAGPCGESEAEGKQALAGGAAEQAPETTRLLLPPATRAATQRAGGDGGSQPSPACP